LEEIEGLNYKIGGLRVELEIEIEFQGARCKICKGLGLQVNYKETQGTFFAKFLGILI
jgi:hypothetical protein